MQQKKAHQHQSRQSHSRTRNFRALPLSSPLPSPVLGVPLVEMRHQTQSHHPHPILVPRARTARARQHRRPRAQCGRGGARFVELPLPEPTPSILSWSMAQILQPSSSRGRYESCLPLRSSHLLQNNTYLAPPNTPSCTLRSSTRFQYQPHDEQSQASDERDRMVSRSKLH